jgi:hypothetical protein
MKNAAIIFVKNSAERFTGVPKIKSVEFFLCKKPNIPTLNATGIIYIKTFAVAPIVIVL